MARGASLSRPMHPSPPPSLTCHRRAVRGSGSCAVTSFPSAFLSPLRPFPACGREKVTAVNAFQYFTGISTKAWGEREQLTPPRGRVGSTAAAPDSAVPCIWKLLRG